MPRLSWRRTGLQIRIFFLGLLTCVLFWFGTESTYEKEIFDNISAKINRQQPGSQRRKDSFALAALHMTYYLQERRNKVFDSVVFTSVKYQYFRPVTVDLMTGDGACGSFSMVLARILKANNMHVRLGQMVVHGIPSGHIFVEAETENGWIVLDPLYDLVYHRPDGRFASYDDLHQNWDYYKQQVPLHYNLQYRYESVHYTNWNKLGFVSRLLHWTLLKIYGEAKTEKISLRPYLLRIYHKLFWLTLFAWLLLLLTTWRWYRKKRELPDKPLARKE